MGRPRKVNLSEAFGRVEGHWSPKVAAEPNGQHVRLVRMLGEFVWHSHEGEDELFLAVEGGFTMQFRDGEERVEEGEMILVPRGVEHRPAAEEEAHVLLFEPAGTVNTGGEENRLTAKELGRV